MKNFTLFFDYLCMPEGYKNLIRKTHLVDFDSLEDAMDFKHRVDRAFLAKNRGPIDDDYMWGTDYVESICDYGLICGPAIIMQGLEAEIDSLLN